MRRRPDPSDPASLLPLRPLDFAILVALSQGEQYGYGLTKAVAEQGFGAIRLAPGNLYQVLDRLIGWRLVVEADRRSRPERRAERRRYYAITDFGRAVAVREAERLAAMADNIAALTTNPPRSENR